MLSQAGIGVAQDDGCLHIPDGSACPIHREEGEIDAGLKWICHIACELSNPQMVTPSHKQAKSGEVLGTPQQFTHHLEERFKEAAATAVNTSERNP